MVREDSKAKYRETLKSIEKTPGAPVALAAQALASLYFSICTTNALLDELQQLGVPINKPAQTTIRALWTDTQRKLEHALIAPFLAGLSHGEATALALRLRDAALSLASLPSRPSTRDAVAAGKKAKKHSGEHLANQSAVLKNRKSPRKGVTLSQERRGRMSESKTGKR